MEGILVSGATIEKNLAKISLVGSDKKDAYILERAKAHNIPTITLDYKQYRTREEAESIFVEKLRENRCQLVLLIGFMKILSPYFVNAFRGRVWNIHPSLLPKYAGGMNMDVHEKVLANHEKETGCTLHEVSEDVDAGKTIMQKKCTVEKDDTPQTLKAKVQKLEQECLLEAIKSVIEGKITIGEQLEG